MRIEAPSLLGTHRGANPGAWLKLSLVLGSLAFAGGCAGAAGNGVALSPRAGAELAITAPEDAAIRGGHIVARPLDFQRGASHYVGGIASGLVPAPAERVLAALDDVAALSAMLPRTKRATLVDVRGDSRRVELLQGNSFVDATYTVELVASESPGELRFRLDPTRPHDIDDVYGYFRVEPVDEKHSLITMAAAVDVGSGLTELLFGKRVQDVILSAPYQMRDYFARAEFRERAALVARNDGR